MKIQYYTRPNSRSREAVVREFINRKERIGWFSSKTNSMYGQKDKIEAFLMHWAKTGEFGPDYDDHTLIEAKTDLSVHLRNCI